MRIDLTDALGRGGGRADLWQVAGEPDLFDQSVPLATRGALTRPFRVRCTAIGTDVFDLRFGHDRHHR